MGETPVQNRGRMELECSVEAGDASTGAITKAKGRRYSCTSREEMVRMTIGWGGRRKDMRCGVNTRHSLGCLRDGITSKTPKVGYMIQRDGGRSLYIVSLIRLAMQCCG